MVSSASGFTFTPKNLSVHGETRQRVIRLSEPLDQTHRGKTFTLTTSRESIKRTEQTQRCHQHFQPRPGNHADWRVMCDCQNQNPQTDRVLADDQQTSVHHYILHHRSIHLNLYVLDFAVVFLCFVSQRCSVRPGVAFYWRSKHLQLIGPDQNLLSYLHLPVSTSSSTQCLSVSLSV